jgi:hypothetical protein
MSDELFPIKNKIPGLAYAFTLNGVELPVLDITHHDFISCTDEKILNKLLPYVQKNADKNAEKFNKLPAFFKKYLIKHSFGMAELLEVEKQNTFASGITTIMMKLGPRLIGKGKKRFWDRQMNKGFGALLIRMRARDISKCQTEALMPLLIKQPGNDLCFINIAGGAASDNINALFLIQKENPALLKGRRIEINVLDIDSFGPAFADRCITALKAPGGRFNELDVSFRHIHYDWNNTEKLEELLSERKGWLQLCSSEGGLFEYCSDEVIIRNLNAVFNHSGNEIIVAGTLMHDIKDIDAGMAAALKISTNIAPRLLGINGLKSIIADNRWDIGNIIEDNPRYLVFSLKKTGNRQMKTI